MTVGAAVGYAIGAAMIMTPGVAAAHSTTRAGARTIVVASSASAPLTMLSQTPWVTPGKPFDLQLEAAGTSVPAAQLGVSVAVYSCLSSVSAFDQSVSSSSGPSGTPISSTRSPLPVSGLPAITDGGFDLSMPVVVGGAQSLTPSSGYTVDLTSAGQQCGLYPSGVYPVRVQLVNTSSKQVIAGITTHLVYTDAGADTQKLRFAVVLPVQMAMSASSTPTSAQLLAHPQAALEQPSPAATTGVTGMVATLADPAHSTVPVTLEASPQAVSDLDDSGHQSTVAQLAALASGPSVQFASTPFAPVDASSLVDAGLSSELARQVSRGTQVLDTTVTHPAVTTGTPDLGAWITNNPLDADTLTQLESDGYSRLILPTNGVSSSPTNGSTAEPFQLAPARGSPLTALTSNADLASRFTGTPGDPVLAAHQLIAELAQIYYEKPNDATPRGVATVAPTGWSANQAFVNALLGALANNPIIEPVTTTDLLNTLSTTTCRNGCKLISANSGSGLPVAAIRAQRHRIDSFFSAAPTAHQLSAPLGDLVLAGESELLRPAQQSAVLHNTGLAVDAQLEQLVVAGDQTITLTSQQGTLPIDIVSSAPFPMNASLTVTSDKLLFPNGSTQWTKPGSLPLHSGTNIIDVPVTARTSGVFTVAIVLHSPTGGLELSNGQLTVRSTATSVVGIALSLGAVVVLLVWWIRTSRKRRALRRGDELEAAGVPPGTQ
jgi:hypothetical protein